jgi:O-antigen/teichoic acid export membrane protein
MLASAAAGISKGLLAAVLTVSGFGAFALAQTLLEYGTLLCEFGLFLPAARAAALIDADRRREIVGGALVLYLPIAAIFLIGLVGASFLVDRLFHVYLGGSLRSTAILAVGWPFTLIGLQLAQGVGRIHLWSLTTLAGQLLFLLALLGIGLILNHTTVETALVAKNASVLIAAILLMVWLKPRFRHVLKRVRGLLHGARRYGFQVYVGRVLSTGTYNMDILMLAALTDAKAVAYYALAGAIATGVGLPVTGFGNVLFSRMTRSPQLNTVWLALAWGVGLATVPATWLLTRVAVGTVFPSAYAPVIGLVVPLALAQVFRGVTNVYNTFLSAHGRGRELRNAAGVLTVSNLVFNFALIPPFGAMGAAVASLLALVINCAAYVVSYRRLISENVSKPSPATPFGDTDTNSAPPRSVAAQADGAVDAQAL